MKLTALYNSARICRWLAWVPAILLTAQAGFAQIFPPPGPYPSYMSLRIVAPANHATFQAPVDVAIFAYGHYPLYAFTNVEFYANGTDLGSAKGMKAITPLPPIIRPIAVEDEYSLVWTNPTPGVYNLTARGASIRDLAVTSPPVQITILGPPPAITNLPDVVSVVAVDPTAIEGTNCWVWRGWTNAPTWTNWPPRVWQLFTNCGPKNATFAVRRFGDSSNPLTVTYTLGGTATNGVDYVSLPGNVTIPAGAAMALIDIVPIDDGLVEPDKTVVLTLVPPTTPGNGWVVGYPRMAGAVIIESSRPHPITGMLGQKLFHVQADGPDGAWFRMEYSTGLNGWTSICTNQVVNGSIDFIDPDASDANRFYRAVPLNGPTGN